MDLIPLPAPPAENPTSTKAATASMNAAAWKENAKKCIDKVPPAAKIGFVVVLVLLVCGLVAYFVGKAQTSHTKKNLPLVQRLIREASRWGTSSAQDSSPLVSLMHANYALAYARAARELMSETEIARMLRIDLSELIHYLTAQQEKAVQKCSRVCPELIPDAGPISVASGWIA